VNLRKTFRYGSLLLLVAWFATARAELPRPDPVPGGVAVIPLADGAGDPPRVWYRDRRVMTVATPEGWRAVVGIPLHAEPGSQRLRIENGAGEPAILSFRVRSKHYEEQHITLKNRRMVTPNAEDLKRIRREKGEIVAALAAFHESEMVNTAFVSPVAGTISSPFGLRRFFNEQPRQPHSGLDIAAPKGTPVRAPAAGRVTTVGDYFFNGRTLFLDHGNGLVTMYCHLDTIDVQPGTEVAQGARIATVGMTGRVTGPHLHWGVSLNDVRVDPTLFMSRATLAALNDNE